jgi:hypothetical protein
VNLADLPRVVQVKDVNNTGIKSWQSWYVVTADVPVQNIFDDVTVTLLDSAGETITNTLVAADWSTREDGVFSYTIKEYATGLLTDETYGAVAQALLDYGKVAKNYFAARNNGETVALTRAEQERLDTALQVDLTEKKPIKSDNTKLSGIEFYGTSLAAESNTRILHYFKITNAEAWTAATNNIGNKSNVDSLNYAYIEITGVDAANLDYDYTLILSDESTDTIKITYSGLSYAWTIINKVDSSKTEQHNLAKGLILYWSAAQALAESMTN